MAKSIEDVLYPKIEPYATGMLPFRSSYNCLGVQRKSRRHSSYCHPWRPGGGSQPSYRRYFDPSKWNIIQFDQRGCGKSTPYAELEENSTMNLVSDIEALGKLWNRNLACFWRLMGLNLSLIYGITHPSRLLIHPKRNLHVSKIRTSLVLSRWCKPHFS